MKYPRRQNKLPRQPAQGQPRCGAFHPDGHGCGCWYEQGHEGPHGTNLQSYAEHWCEDPDDAADTAAAFLNGISETMFNRATQPRKRADRSTWDIRWRIEAARTILQAAGHGMDWEPDPPKATRPPRVR